MNSKAAFLDRDGVINRKPAGEGYVTRWEEMQFLPGVSKAIGLLNRAGFRVIVVTNQRCVAKGLVTTEYLDFMHRRMREDLARASAVIDAVMYCPHEEVPPCGCRKPAPGMLLAAAEAHQIDLSASWMIGDSESDVLAGRNAGCKTALILRIGEAASGNADVVAPSLLDAIRQIVKSERILAASTTSHQNRVTDTPPPRASGGE